MNVKTKIKLFFDLIKIEHQFKKVTMKNWKTSLFLTLSALCLLSGKYFPQFDSVCAPASGLFLAIGGIVAQDGDVSDAKIPQATETEKRTS